MKNELIEKLNNRTAKIGVVGLGYVGLPLVIRYLEVGYPILGFDINKTVVKGLLAGESHIEHIDPAGIQKGVEQNRFDATTNFARAAEADAIILCLPTPLNINREPDLSYVQKSVDTLAPYMRPGQVMVLESTTYPGTTEEEIRPRLEARGFTIGEDVFLVYSPEREDPGNPNFETRTIPKVCSGSTEACLEVGLALYDQVIDNVIPISTTRGAEMVKILENTYRAVNIALVNELKLVADRMGLDIFEIIRAAATKPFGYKAFYPGPGLGGHCIPIDPFYLTWKAREYGIETRFIELAGEVNSTMPDHVIHKCMEALNHHQKPVKGSKVLVLGVAYKPNVDDMRESPSLVLLEKLERLGAEISYSDPHVPVIPKLRKHKFDLESTPLTAESLSSFDLVLVSTDHKRFDWDFIKEHAALIIDTRGVYTCDGDRIWRA